LYPPTQYDTKIVVLVKLIFCCLSFHQHKAGGVVEKGKETRTTKSGEREKEESRSGSEEEHPEEEAGIGR